MSCAVQVGVCRCEAGVVADRCGCCQECARTEGQLCNMAGQDGQCGDNLECELEADTGEHLCVCRERKAGLQALLLPLTVLAGDVR